MKIPLDRSADRNGRLPLARQIQLHFERLISQRLLAPGVKLPATRELAQELGVNRTTVAQAYEDLVAGGWARAHVGQGTFVADAAPTAPPAAPTAPRLEWTGFLSKAAQIVAADARRREAWSQSARPGPGIISFAGGVPDSALFPTDAFRRVLNRVIREEGRELLQYYPSSGYPPLRQYLSSYLLRFGLEARPEDILIVNGTQQGFDLVARTLLDPGDFVAIEQPSYPRAMQVFRAFGAQLLPVPMAGGGLSVEHLERLLERQAPKLLYCQPSAHNPTGLTMPAAARRRLLDVAARHRLPIVEDGFDGTLFYGERPPAPLKAADASGQVIYLGTFSKILFPPSSRRPSTTSAVSASSTGTRRGCCASTRGAAARCWPPSVVGCRTVSAGRRPRAASRSSWSCPRAWRRRPCCLAPSSAAWPSRRAMPSSPTAGASGRSASPFRPCPSLRSKRACDVSPTAFASSDVTRSGAPACAGPPCRWSRSRHRGLRDPGRARGP